MPGSGAGALQDAIAAGGRWWAILLLLATGSAHAALNVVATTPDLGAIAEVVGGEHIKLTTLARPAEDAHFVDPKPSFIAKLNRADVLLQGGAELESGWLPPLLAGTRNGRIAPGTPGNVRCNEGVEMLEVPTVLDRAQGDIHALGNPHYLVDPVNAGILARHLGEVFAQLDEANAAAYRSQATRFVTQLEAKQAEWQQKLEPYRGGRVVAYHNSWPYFARRFGLQIEVFLEPKPGIPPSPAHLAGVISTMREQQIGVVFVDPYLSRKTAETAAAATGAQIVNVTQYPGGVKGSEGGYIQMMDYLVNAVADAFARNLATR